MEFYRPARSSRQVPIIPLIDILAILLIFLIVSSTFKKKRPVMKLNLPTVENLPTATITDPRAVIAVDGDGTILLDGLHVPDGLLVDYLEVFRDQNPDRKLELEADQGITLDQLLHVWEALTKVGVPVGEVPTRIKVAAPDAETQSGDSSQ